MYLLGYSTVFIGRLVRYLMTSFTDLYFFLYRKNMSRPIRGISCIWKIFLQQDIAKYHGKLLIQTLSSSLSVYAVSLFHKLDLEELRIEFGTGVNLEWLPIHECAENLGENICQAMPVWFAFTSCDTVSAFFGRGKRLTWNTLKSYYAATDTFKM